MMSAGATPPGVFLKVASVSYEGSIFGWDVAPDSESHDAGLQTTLSFGFHCSAGSLRALAVSASGKYMCCGGMDERIHVFDVESKRAVGEITGHTGAVTCLCFIGDTNLLSGSEDTTICIWRVYDWQCLHILGGHKAGVNGIGVHPSGKLALTVSKDSLLKTWNLVHGRCAFTRRLKKPADKVLWHADGQYYLLVMDSELQLFNSEDNNTCVVSCSFGNRINQAVFCNTASGNDAASSCIAVVCENKMLHIVELTGKKVTGDGVDLSSVLENGRPRDMWSCKPAAVGSAEMQEIIREEGDCLAIVTSNGLLVVLSCRAVCQQVAEEQAAGADIADAVLSSMQITAQPRLTALTAWVPVAKPSKKKERKEKDDVVEKVGDEKKRKVKFAEAEDS